MTTDGPKSSSKRREIRAKHVKKLASGEKDESENKRVPKRGREGISVDEEEPLIKKAASTIAVETADNKPKTSDSYLSKTR